MAREKNPSSQHRDPDRNQPRDRGGALLIGHCSRLLAGPADRGPVTPASQGKGIAGVTDVCSDIREMTTVHGLDPQPSP